MSLSPERLKELKEMGLDLKQQPLINTHPTALAKAVLENKQKKVEPSFKEDYTKDILNVIKIESKNTEELLRLNASISAILATLVEQKQFKKNYVCSVERDKIGNINKVNIKEQ